MKLQKLKFPLKKDGEVSYNKIKKDPLLLKSFEDIEDTPEYKKYCYQLLLIITDFVVFLQNGKFSFS